MFEKENNKIWKFLNGIVYSAGAIFIGLIIPGLIVVYIFIFRPALQDMVLAKNTNQPSSLPTAFFPGLSQNIGNVYNLDSIYYSIKDSLADENSYINNYPQGAVTVQYFDDFRAIILEFYNDCNCPLEENNVFITRLTFTADSTNGVLLFDSQEFTADRRIKTQFITTLNKGRANY